MLGKNKETKITNQRKRYNYLLGFGFCNIMKYNHQEMKIAMLLKSIFLTFSI